LSPLLYREINANTTVNMLFTILIAG